MHSDNIRISLDVPRGVTFFENSCSELLGVLQTIFESPLSLKSSMLCNWGGGTLRLTQGHLGGLGPVGDPGQCVQR